MSQDRITVQDVLDTKLEPNQSVMAVMNASGDLKCIWDRTKPSEVEAVRAQFKDFKKKGYMAYKVTEGGNRGEILHDFDPDAQSVILAPALKGGK
jgi:hypothetical protein